MASKERREYHCSQRYQLSVRRKGAGLQIMLFLLNGRPWFYRSIRHGVFESGMGVSPMESRARSCHAMIGLLFGMLLFRQSHNITR